MCTKRLVVLNLSPIDNVRLIWERARTCAASIAIIVHRSSAFLELAKAQIQAGLWTDAQVSIATIDLDYHRVKALSALAVAQVQTNHSMVPATFEIARTIAMAMPSARLRAHTLVDLAAAQAQAAHPDMLGTFALARTNADAITDNVERGDALGILVEALAQAGLWNEAQSTASAITHADQRAAALAYLAVAQSQANHPDMGTTFAMAHDSIVSMTYSWDRATTHSILHDAMIQVDSVLIARHYVATIWRVAQTSQDLLAMAKIAYPLILHDSALGHAMVAAFAWVDDQPREG